MSISFSGLASGLDTSSWITSLTALKQAKVTTLQAQATTITAAQSSLSSIKSLFASFRTSLEKLTDARFNIDSLNLFAQNLANSSNLNVLTATATTAAEEGVYNITVDRLATNSRAVSAYKTSSTRTETNIATKDTLLSELGVNAGNIQVTVGGVGYTLAIENGETIDSFTNKLKDLGVNAAYLEMTGKFVMDIDSSALNAGSTNLVNAFHLTNVNQGYSTAAGITRTETEVVYENATNSTKLSELGLASNSSMQVRINGGSTQTVTVNKNDSIGTLISNLSAKGVQASLDDGIFTIYNAEIINADSNAVAQALGLSSVITNQTQESASLTYNTTLYDTTLADRNTKLVDLGVASGTVIRNFDSSPFTVSNNSTLGQAIDHMNASAPDEYIISIEDGVFSTKYSGQLGEALGLTDADKIVYSVTQSGRYVYYSHSTTIVSTTQATGTTKFGTIMGYNTYHEAILRFDNDGDESENYSYFDNDTTVNEFVSDLNSSLTSGTASYDQTTATLLIHNVGKVSGRGSYQDLKLEETVATQTMTSGQLTYQTVTTETSAATLATKLNNLNEGTQVINGDTIVFRNSAGLYRTITLNTNSTLNDIKVGIENAGGSVTRRENGSLYITGAEFTGGTYDIVSSLRLSASSSGGVLTYSGSSLSFDTVTTSTHNADNDTLLSDLGVTSGQFSVYQDGVKHTAYISEGDTVGDLRSLLQGYGIQAALTTGARLKLYAESDSYVEASSASGSSNVVGKLFSSGKTTTYDYTAQLDIVSTKTEYLAMNRDSLFKDYYDNFTGEYYIYDHGVRSSAYITNDTTIGEFMDTLANHGIQAAIVERVSEHSPRYMILNGDGESYIADAPGNNSITMTMFDGMKLVDQEYKKTLTWEKPRTETINPDSDTLMSDYGVTSGQYHIFNNGVKYTVNISTNETFGSFRDTLRSFGVQASFVQKNDGVHVVLSGAGDSYVAKSSAANASNVVDRLFSTKTTEYNYSAHLQTSRTDTHTITATETAKIADFVGGGANVAGKLSVVVDGVNSTISLGADETFESFITKLEKVGITAALADDGSFTMQTGEKSISITKADSGGSNVMARLGLTYNSNLGGYMASSTAIMHSKNITEENVYSASNYADNSTQLGLLNISSGSLAVYRNGQKATIQVNKDETFNQLKTKINNAFSAHDVDIKFENGILKFYSSTSGVNVEVGSSVDTSNLSTLCSLVSDGNGAVVSSRELYRVNNDVKIMQSGLFRKGNVTAGTFTVGDAVFSIDANTKMSDIIGQINASDDANATAYWDSVDGKLVITSRSSGSAYINIEAGTSNFTDGLGFTESQWNNGAVTVTRLNGETQQIGDSALFKINGTTYTATSNIIDSDITRINGVKLNLKNVSEGETVTLSIERDTSTLANAVSDVIDSYNELIDNVDKEIAKSGNLSNQSGLKMLRNQIRSMMTSSIGGGLTFSNLASIGISVDAASASNVSTSGINKLSFDEEKFTSAFRADASSLKKLLVGTEENKGVLSKVEDLVENSLTSVSGYFATAEAGYTKQLQKLQDKITKQNKSVSNYQARLENKFRAMESIISKIQQQYQSFLS